MPPWICDVCNVGMSINNRDQHLAGQKHQKKAAQVATVPLSTTVPVSLSSAASSAQVASTAAPVPQSTWRCDVCKRTLNIYDRDAHLAGKKHRANVPKLVPAPTAHVASLTSAGGGRGRGGITTRRDITVVALGTNAVSPSRGGAQASGSHRGNGNAVRGAGRARTFLSAALPAVGGGSGHGHGRGIGRGVHTPDGGGGDDDDGGGGGSGGPARGNGGGIPRGRGRGGRGRGRGGPNDWEGPSGWDVWGYDERNDGGRGWGGGGGGRRGGRRFLEHLNGSDDFDEDDLAGIVYDIDTAFGLLPHGGAYKESNFYNDYGQIVG